MTLLIIKFTNSVTPTYFLVHLNADLLEQNLVYFCTLTFMQWNIVMDKWDVDENHFISDNFYNIVNL